MTKAERIKHLTDKELTDWLLMILDDQIKKCCDAIQCSVSVTDENRIETKAAWLNWLQEES